MTDASPSLPAATVVVVTWNSATTIGACLGPLAGDPRLELVVVDNASADTTLDEVARAAPGAVRIRTGGNCGFAAGVDVGAERATSDVIVLLNPDCVADPDTVIALADHVRRDGLAIAAPALVDDNRKRTRSTRRLPTVRDQWAVALGLHRLSARLDPDDDGGVSRADDPCDVEVVSGACFATSTRMFRELGGLDPRFFLYAEEVDYCRRVAATGANVRLFPSLEVLHIGGVSADLTSSGTDAVLRESRVRYFHKHHGRAAAQLVRAALFTGTALRVPAALWRDLVRPSTPRWRRSRGQLRSVQALARPMTKILTPTHPLAAPELVD